MPKEWIGDLVKIMNNHGIIGIQLAKEMGVTNRYVSMIRNGHQEPAGTGGRFRIALLELIRKQNTVPSDLSTF